MTQRSKNGVLLETLNGVDRLLLDGRLDDAVDCLEAAVLRVRTSPASMPFVERIDLTMALTDLYLMDDRREQALELLTIEAGFVEQIWRVIQKRGTREQIRDATAGRSQLTDRAAQVALIGEAAPELDVAEWLVGDSTTLAQQRGRVVLLEFWAYSCRPCLTALAMLNDLHTRYHHLGLTILAMTRYVSVSSRDSSTEQARQRAAIGQTLAGRAIDYQVGIAPDARLQERYGAMGIPVSVLIDRQGIVQLVSTAADEMELEAAIQDLLEVPVDHDAIMEKGTIDAE